MKIWGLAVVLAVAGVVSLELGLRMAGYQPGFMDTPGLWALYRGSVYPRFPGERVLVLVGGSRIQLDLDPSVLSTELHGARVVQLAIDGSSGLPVLYDLATDPGFAGSVLVSLKIPDLVKETGRAREYVSHFHQVRGNLNAELNARARMVGESTLVIRGGQFRLLGFLTGLLRQRRIPPPPYLRMLPDRSIRADYSRLDVEEHRRARLARAADAVESWEREDLPADTISRSVERLSRAVRILKARGGAVALVRFPVGEELWAMQSLTWPKDRFWDEMATSVEATTLHFRDDPVLDAFPLPDESHLDYRDAPAFTRALLRALQERGFMTDR